MSDLGSPGGWRGGAPGSGGDVGTFSGTRRWVWDLEEGLHGGRGVRAREALANLSGGRGERRSPSLQTPGSQPGAQAGGGRVRASARRAVVLWGAPRAFGVSVCESKQAGTESSKCTQTYFCPGNPSLSEVQAFLQEPGNGQRELNAGWIVREMPPPPSDFLHFILERLCGEGGSGGLHCPLLAFS